MIRLAYEPDDRAPEPPQQGAVRMGTLGMWLFLAALTMLFGASLTGYLIIRVTSVHSPAAGTVRLPPELWASSALVIGVSIALWGALRAVRRERQHAFRFWLIAAMALAAGFIAVQTPAMVQLLHEHAAALRRLRAIGAPPSAGTALYGLIFVLILLHALHVIGGIVALLIVGLRARQNAYDHEHFAGVRHAALYWHFLDIVWLVMFTTFFLTQ
jgi:heme/copper-type cytochrome/quinol oxidase subunit 3